MFAVAYLVSTWQGVNSNISGLLKCGESYADNDWDQFDEKDIAEGIKKLTEIDETKGIAALLQCGISLFKIFPCNHLAASIVSRKLYIITSILCEISDNSAKKPGKPIAEASLAELEELLSDTLSRPDFRKYLLVGNDPEEALNKFHDALPDIMTRLILSTGRDAKFYKWNHGSSDRYYFICDKLPSARKQKSLDEEVAPYAAAACITGVDATLKLTEEIRSELAAMKDVVKDLTSDTMLLVDIDHCLIQQRAFRSLWLKRPKRKLSLLLKDFVEEVRRELAANSVSSREAHVLVQKLIEALNSGKPLEAGDQVDEYVVAKLVRSIPENETSLAKAIKLINPGLMTPPLQCHSQIYFSVMQESSIEHALTSRGWTSLTGPSLSGKTCRLRYIVDKLIKKDSAASLSFDVVWVDFDGVTNELDGIMRIASQLYFRRCNTMTILEKNLRNLFRALKVGSIVVFDNVYFAKEGYSTTSNIYQAVDLMESEHESESDVAGQDVDEPAHELDMNVTGGFYGSSNHATGWRHFISHICRLGKEFDHICFAVVSNVCEPLESVISFDQKLTISSVTPSIALEMAGQLVPDTKCATLVPIDPFAIITASNCLTGEMSLLIKWGGSLRELRNLAEKVELAKVDLNAIHRAKVEAATIAFQHLSRDSKLLACTLFCHHGNFTIPAVCSVAKDIFHGDIVKFRLAWDGLLDAGWIVHSYELGFKLSSLASLIRPSHVAIDSQFLYDNYVLHWATELVRINEAGAQTPSALDEFSRYSVHFRHVFNNILELHAKYDIDGNNAAPADTAHILQRNKKLLTVRSNPALLEKHRNAPAYGQSKSDGKGDELHGAAKKVSRFSSLKKLSHSVLHASSKSVASNATHESIPHEFEPNDLRDKSAESENSAPKTLTRKFSLIHAPSKRSSQKFVQFNDEFGDGNGPEGDVGNLETQSEWICSDIESHNLTYITKISRPVVEKIIEILAGKIGRILSYHVPPVVGLKISKQIMSMLNPLDGTYYDAAVVDFAEQCLRNDLVTDGISHIQQIISLFFAPRDTEVHDPPPFAARALLVQARLFIEENAFANALRALEAADHILSLEGWSVAEHYERKVINNYRREAMHKSSTIGMTKEGLAHAGGHTNTSDCPVDTASEATGKRGGFFQRLGLSKSKK